MMRRYFAASIYLLAAFMFPLSLASQEDEPEILPSGVMVVQNGTVIDGTGAAPIPDGLVAILNGEIVGVGPETAFQVPEDAQVLDALGGAILPGFIDTHAHVLSAVNNPASLRRILTPWLSNGVTTVRDPFPPLQDTQTITELRALLTDLDGTSSTLVFGGRIITADEGYPIALFGARNLALEVSDVEEARQAAIELLDAGTDGITVAIARGADPSSPWPTLKPEQVAAVVETADQYDAWVAVETVGRLDDAAVAIDAGVGSVLHGLVHPVSDELIQQMVDREVAQASLLTLMQRLRGTLASANGVELSEVLANQPDNFRRLLDAGGMIVLGSDYPHSGLGSGMPIRELEAMLDVGMTPMEVIVASTQHAAHAVGLNDTIGTLEAGKQADVIVVNGNPLEDIQVMSEVIFVIKNGEIIVEPEM